MRDAGYDKFVGCSIPETNERSMNKSSTCGPVHSRRRIKMYSVDPPRGFTLWNKSLSIMEKSASFKSDIFINPNFLDIAWLIFSGQQFRHPLS